MRLPMVEVMWLSAPESMFHSPDGGGVRDVVLNVMAKAFRSHMVPG
jgi:hypothetical protein